MEDTTSKNYIIAKIEIGDENINKDIRILNSEEEFTRTNYPSFPEMLEVNKHLNNEESIKKCEIRIDDELIPFSYFHKFNKKGKYWVKYSFKNCLTHTNNMFNSCDCLTMIDLSNFNAEKVTCCHFMFGSWGALRYLDLSCFDKKTSFCDSRGIVGGCTALKFENVITNNEDILFSVKHSLANDLY